MTALAEAYATVAKDLAKEWGTPNLYEVPRLERVVVNVGMGQAKEEKTYKDLVMGTLAEITGQKPMITRARKSIAGFKLREGMEIGAKVTLRGKRMEDFFYRLVHIVLPRVRDFRGLSKKGFDGHGNYSLGLTEHTVFPEISYEDVTQVHPMGITIVTTSDDDDKAYQLLKRLGFPFTEKVVEVAKAPETAAKVDNAKQQQLQQPASKDKKPEGKDGA